MKLFSGEKVVAAESVNKFIDSKESELDLLESEFVKLEDSVDAYVSVGVVYESIAEESYSFVDKKNRVLFNEYIKNITKNLDLDSVPKVSLESVENNSIQSVNSELSLEGFLGNLWEKVKTLFKKIYETVKAFFVKHFTRMGRVKKKLENLKEVLNETDKDIKVLSSDKVPGPIAKAFPYEGEISSSTVEESMGVIKSIIGILKVTNKDAIALAGKDVLDKDFVVTVKGLKDQIKANKDKIDDNNSNKTSGIKGMYGEGKANNKDIKEDNKSLSEMNKENTSEVNKKENQLNDTVNSKDNIAAVFDDKDFETAKREMSSYYTEVAKSFKAIVGKPIAGGKVLKEATVNEEGISLEFDENKDTPSTVSLGSRDKLKAIVSDMLESISEIEKVTDGYGKVNDAIMKNVDTVDSLMKDLDKITDNSDYQAYKAVLEKKVRERLKYMQKFFTEYNKISKNLIETVASVGDGVIAYGVSSLKNFG